MLENGQLLTLKMSDILPNRFQPRIHFNEEKLNELADSIRKYGLIQPIVVRQIGNKYEIIAGERRFKASALANRETIPAIVVVLSDRDSEEIALLENIQREDLTPIEEAVSYKRILDIGYITQEELARKIGKSQSAIANKIRLLNLDDIVQEALLNGKISERHARSLLRIHNNEQQVFMLDKIIKERLTVKMTDKAIMELLAAGEQKSKEVSEKTRRAIPVASHKIIKVDPPKELEEALKKKNERGIEGMDIDKILAEAQDITPVDEPKPANDIEDLMKQNPETTTSPLIKSETEVPSPQEILEPGKFVSPVVNENNEVKEEHVQPVATSSVTFDSIFNQTPIQNSTHTAPTPEVLSMEPTKPAPVEPAAVAPTPVPVAPFAPAAVEPTSVSATPVESDLKSTLESVPPVDIPTPIEPAANTVTSASIQPEPTSVAVEPIMKPLEPVSPVQPQSTIPVSSAPVMPAARPQIMDIPDDEILEAPAPAPRNNINNFKQVIDLIRGCADQIEKLGYYIDVDEIDLNDQYQVTFKISKE